MSGLGSWAMRHSGGVILVFHDIDPECAVGFVDCIGRMRIVHLDEIVERARQGKSNAGLVAITVDDGVGDTVRELARVFKARGWPATFYLPTHYIDTGSGIAFQLWRKLKPFLPRSVVRLPSRTIDLSAPRAVEELERSLALSWYTMPPESYLGLTGELREFVEAEVGVDAAVLAPPSPITWAEVEELSKCDLIRFESHSVSHGSMSAMSEEDLRAEMRQSRDFISEHTGRECRHLAYPFGSAESIGRLAPSIAREYYESATTMSLGYVDGASRWLLPRIPLYPENSRLVARLKVVLKGSRLRTGSEVYAGVPG